MTRSYSFGNARNDELGEHAWFVGHFMPNQDILRHSNQVEVKWGIHRAGESQQNWVLNKEATSLCILVKGLFQIRFPEADLLLSKEGDYVIWGPGIAHSWLAEEDSVMITLRWPSQADDMVTVADPRAATLPIRSGALTRSLPGQQFPGIDV